MIMHSGSGPGAWGHCAVYESRFVIIATSFPPYSLWDQRTQKFQNYPLVKTIIFKQKYCKTNII